MDLLGIRGEQAESEAITPDPRARHSSKVPQGFDVEHSLLKPRITSSVRHLRASTDRSGGRPRRRH